MATGPSITHRWNGSAATSSGSAYPSAADSAAISAAGWPGTMRSTSVLQNTLAAWTQALKAAGKPQASAYCRTQDASFAPLASISSQGRNTSPGAAAPPSASNRACSSAVTFAGKLAGHLPATIGSAA